MEELASLVKQLQQRIESLERQLDNKDVIIPTDGSLIVDNRATDPTGTPGRIYYSTTSGKFRVYASGAWRDMDTTP